MGRQTAALFSVLSFVHTAAKQQALFEATDNLTPTYFIAAKAKTFPTACDIYCPARAVCDRCWRGRCDYEGQDQLCFGCAESSCYNDRILQNSNYREAKQKSTNAAIAMAAAAAMAQDSTVDGQAFDTNKTRNSRGGNNKNRALVIIQSDRTTRVGMADESVDFHPSKGGNNKPKKNNANLMSVGPSVLSFGPQQSTEKRRAGHLPDSQQQLGALVDQRVWVPVTPYGIFEEVKPRMTRQMYFDDEALGQRSRQRPPLTPSSNGSSSDITTTTTTTKTTTATAAEESRGLLEPPPAKSMPKKTRPPPSTSILETGPMLEIEPPVSKVTIPPAEVLDDLDDAQAFQQEEASGDEDVSPLALAEREEETGSVPADADAYRPPEQLIGSEIEEPTAVHPIAIATLAESASTPQPARIVVGGFRRGGGLVANLLSRSTPSS